MKSKLTVSGNNWSFDGKILTGTRDLNPGRHEVVVRIGGAVSDTRIVELASGKVE